MKIDAFTRFGMTKSDISEFRENVDATTKRPLLSPGDSSIQVGDVRICTQMGRLSLWPKVFSQQLFSLALMVEL